MLHGRAHGQYIKMSFIKSQWCHYQRSINVHARLASVFGLVLGSSSSMLGKCSSSAEYQALEPNPPIIEPKKNKKNLFFVVAFFLTHFAITPGVMDGFSKFNNHYYHGK